MSDINEVTKKYALLIDSDNVSAKYVAIIFDELSRVGYTTVRKIYGDWSKNTNGWTKDCLLTYSIQPVQQFAYTTGKNATDSIMIIDAMDLLYKGNLDGFCLVSSDSDFTSLAVRLREAGKEVIGMGEMKTPKAFVSACTNFKRLDLLDRDYNSDEGEDYKSADSDEAELTSLRDIKQTIYSIIDENDDRGKKTHIGEIGSKLQNKYADFDVRNYRYSKLTTLIQDGLDGFELVNSGRQIYLEKTRIELKKEDIEKYVCNQLARSKGKRMNIGMLNTMLKDEYSSFSVKKYGYSKMSSFLRSCGKLRVEKDQVMLK